ncbi:hypothetical protein HJC23_010560 [Cyclotella cryptica]|uniref:Sulfotransferase domain-containing protein n=1 Tax=Cyclotella cryptica TaxID=29204 RepID=A0ABD3NWF4_9STRA|eukprot:CCRYP_019506-RA/>CCRYP_019506-RA protein AED:0.01 eAED:0.01 QI:229/-1/1/1/-1/1/1/1303/440
MVSCGRFEQRAQSMTWDDVYLMIRKRTKNTSDGNVDASNASNANDDPHEFRKQTVVVWWRRLSHGKLFLMSCLVSFSGWLLVVLLSSYTTSSTIRGSSSGVVLMSENPSVVVASEKNWSQCTTRNTEHGALMTSNALLNNNTEHSGKVEPLWLPAYPTSLPGKNGGIYSDFLSRVTGIDNAARNYYRSSKTLKRCHSLNNPSNIGVTCEIVHPIVPCERPHPSSQSDNFGGVILVALRNPLTAFPAYHQEKAEKYHNVKGQVEVKDWVSFRDRYVGNGTHSPLFEEWKHFIMEWRNMDPYVVAMYLPFERWFDFGEGPILVKRLAGVLKREGHPVIYDGVSDDNTSEPNDLECTWLKQVREAINAEDTRRATEGWYTPEYRPEQKQMLATMLETFAEEVASHAKGDDGVPRGDDELIGILHEYKDSILRSIWKLTGPVQL